MRTRQTVTRVIGNDMNFVRAARVCLENGLRVRQEVRIVVMCNLDERAAEEIAQEDETAKAMSAGGFHG
jgi:hypothetical protein